MVSGALGDPYLTQGNQLLRLLQALVQPTVINLTTTVPPSSPPPHNGDMYVVAPGATGAWSGKDNAIAYWSTDNPSFPGGEWEFYTPLMGWMVGNQADGNLYKFNGSWSLVTPSNGTFAVPVGYTWRAGFNSTTGFSIGGPAGVIGGSPQVAVAPTQTTPAAVTATHTGSSSYGITYFGGSESASSDIYVTSVGSLKSYQYCFRQNNPAGDARFWLGLSSGLNDSSDGGSVLTDIWESDSNNGEIIGFRYSPNAGDTTWKAYVGGSALGTHTAVNTGVALSQNFTIFQITVVTGDFQFFINGVLVATIPVPALYETAFGVTSGTFRPIQTADNFFLGGSGVTHTESVAWMDVQLNF